MSGSDQRKRLAQPPGGDAGTMNVFDAAIPKPRKQQAQIVYVPFNEASGVAT